MGEDDRRLRGRIQETPGRIDRSSGDDGTLKRALIPIAVGAAIALAPVPPGLTPGAWYYFALLQLAKEPRGGVAIPAGLEQDVDDLAVLVDGPPEVLTLAAELRVKR